LPVSAGLAHVVRVLHELDNDLEEPRRRSVSVVAYVEETGVVLARVRYDRSYSRANWCRQ
jgi:hypothetical protein